jgi:hypothetical protein
MMKDDRRPSIRVQAGVSPSCSHMDMDGGAVGEPPFSEFVAPPHERRAASRARDGWMLGGAAVHLSSVHLHKRL